VRVSADSTLVDLAPGSSADIILDVINTGAVIDGITARVVGLPERQVTTKPPVLALFPEATGRMTVSLGLPSAFPAGRHPLTVEVHSRQPETDPEYLDLDLLVSPQAAFGLFPRPRVARAHRTGRFVLTVTNDGNIVLDVTLSAVDPEKALEITFEPGRLTVEPGRSRDVLLHIRGPRMLLGSEIDRPATVTATVTTALPAVGPPAFDAPVEAAPSVAPAITDDDVPGRAGPDAQSITVTLRQRPWLTRGMLTALILLAIIALWATVFLFGLKQVFATEPPTKVAPLSFSVVTLTAETTQDAEAAPASTAAAASPPGAATPATGAAAPATGAAAPASGAEPTAPAAPAGPPPPGPPPPGALPKDGTMPAGLGGTITGTVRAASSGEPVGRILVDALRPDATGALQIAASGATQADGSYQLAGLFPTDYVLRFSADGFDSTWYPGAPDQTGAAAVPATVDAVTTGKDVVITGKPGSITGTVDPGDALAPVVTTVTVRATQGATAGQDVATTTTDGVNAYSIPNLPAPAVYELSFAAPGYLPSVVSTSVDGGAARIQPTVLLSASNGSITGTVTDGTNPLGGATVSTTVNGTAVTTGTPTTGQVGQFVLGDLPTPATYVLTVSAPGYGQNTVVVGLGPGEQRVDLTLSLAAGTGTLTGQLVDPTGAGIGGAIVTVGGMTNPPTTSTLTDGAVGSFTLSGLSAGGGLTLSFTHPGFAEATVPVQLGGTTPLTVTMSPSQGRITGRVTGANGAPIAGATITATDGQHRWPVTSTAGSPGTPAGGYVISQLPAGPFTVSAVVADGPTQTALATVTAGGDTTLDFVLPDGG
jgi:hypothetical protein